MINCSYSNRQCLSRSRSIEIAKDARTWRSSMRKQRMEYHKLEALGVTNRLYDSMFEGAPATAPYGPEAFAWLGTKLVSFGTERMTGAGELAKSATMQELHNPRTRRDLPGAIWDAISLELDEGQVSAERHVELERMEMHLAQSVHVLRPIVGY